MSKVIIKNESNCKSISVTIDDDAKQAIPKRESGTYPLFEVNPASSVLKLEMKNPDAWRIHGKPRVQQLLHSNIPVPSIDADQDGTKWTLTFTQGTVIPKKTGGTDPMVMGTRGDPTVNVTVGQDIPPENIMSNKAIATGLFALGVGLAVGHYAYKLSPLLWGGLSAMAIIAGIITGILACKKETPQDDTTQTK